MYNDSLHSQSEKAYGWFSFSTDDAGYSACVPEYIIAFIRYSFLVVRVQYAGDLTGMFLSILGSYYKGSVLAEYCSKKK